MSFKVSGKITSITDVKTLDNGAKLLDFNIDTNEKYNNIFSFNVYKSADYADQVEKFTTYNQVGDLVTVEFNVKTREWEGKYFTNLSCWRVDKINELPSGENITANDFAPDRETADLPF
jgi:hypothetical protein